MGTCIHSPTWKYIIYACFFHAIVHYIEEPRIKRVLNHIHKIFDFFSLFLYILSLLASRMRHHWRYPDCHAIEPETLTITVNERPAAKCSWHRQHWMLTAGHLGRRCSLLNEGQGRRIIEWEYCSHFIVVIVARSLWSHLRIFMLIYTSNSCFNPTQMTIPIQYSWTSLAKLISLWN